MATVTRELKFSGKTSYNHFWEMVKISLAIHLSGEVKLEPMDGLVVKVTGEACDVFNVELFKESRLSKPKKAKLVEELESVYGFIGGGTKEVYCEMAHLTTKAVTCKWLWELIEKNHLDVVAHYVNGQRYYVTGGKDVCTLLLALTAKQCPEDLPVVHKRLTEKYSVEFEGIDELITAMSPRARISDEEIVGMSTTTQRG